ncbi:MAG: amidase [Planctomycetaceae bacterium]
MNLPFCNHETLLNSTRAIAQGKLSCLELVQRCLSQIDEKENELHAWVIVDREGAEKSARQLDQELQAGKSRGPLHGIPVGIKDLIDVKGLPTSAGSKLLAREPVSEDAEIIRRLRDAGAIILGKTVTTQFACFDPPVTRNPWNRERTPGGSSSGSAVAVASGMCPAAIGSQTGGSITRPASFCGIAGCKPSFGRVSRRGVFPVSAHLDHVGPMAKTVHDLAIMLDAIAGYDARDPFSVASSDLNLSMDLNENNLSAPRLGRLRTFFEERAESSAIEAIEQAGRCWQSAGATICDIQVPDSFRDLPDCHRTIMVAEAAAVHEQRLNAHPEDYLPGIRSLIEEGLETSVTKYANALTHQKQCTRDVLKSFADVDVLMCPATVGPAPDRSTTGNPIMNSPWSYTGLPTVSIPTGTSEEGLPLSVQLVGKPFGEKELFRVALWCESQLG